MFEESIVANNNRYSLFSGLLPGLLNINWMFMKRPSWIVPAFTYFLLFALPSSVFAAWNNKGDIGIDEAGNSTDSKIVRSKYDQNVVLECDYYGSPEPLVSWWLVHPLTHIGVYNPKDNSTKTVWTRNESYEVQPGGGLMLKMTGRHLVERYRCDISNVHGNVSSIVRYRLDLSDWYSTAIFDSVFWGSCLCAIFVCAISFVLNIAWILCRKLFLWWINRAERLSRVKSMVEAMEKYRRQQLDNLHEKYHSRVTNIRDNYHVQVEQIRSSYANQVERFRDYRHTQFEHMTQHLDNLRENYNQQMGRMRDYGARRAEQLLESYERQVNRMRTFSLQQRLKLQRQYKVKQRYLNKLLEAIADPNNPEAVSRREAAIREALELPEPPHSPLSRSCSYYSLPEYVLDDDGSLHNPPRSVIPLKRFKLEPLEANLEPSTSADVPSTSADVPSTSADVPSTSADVPSTSTHVPWLD
ncbi:hypothetical protein L596_023810 [Steinernema carpocapsae]|uniref:Ig-like domain-containing protein n=1 Tax=Steinernema carpocapsae TaxID=34508 RepID=A0A4U5MEU4_STECR|nr:hypothetical protein L596_023810 [Steinernema carpocapsae]